MDARSLIANVLRPLLRAVEGSVRPGPHYLPYSGGWLPAGAGVNWWQTGISLVGGERSAIVEACIAAYAESVAMCPGDHWRANNKGGRTRVTKSALTRILRKPNDYESISNFLLNAVRCLYADGNCYALALRNNRYEIEQLHLMDPRQSAPRVAMTGDIFYQLGGNEVVDRMLSNEYSEFTHLLTGAHLVVPARDVLHIRLHAGPQHPWPLIGEPPLLAAMADIAASNATAQQQLQYYLNQSRPSAVLSTDLNLDKDQVQMLRERWAEQAKGMHAGGVPILTHGLKVQPWNVPAKDAQIAELAKISQERIALAYRIPLALLGLSSTPFSSTEALMEFWIKTGLGFCINHVEQSFDRLFGFKGYPDEYTEFDTDALLRSAMKDRIEALVRGVQGGIYAPNEARNKEGLDSVPYGDEPRVQAQVVPLSTAGSIPTAPSATSATSAPAPSVPVRELQQDVVAESEQKILAAINRDQRLLN